MLSNAVRNCPECLDFQPTQSKDKIMSCEIPGKPWEFVRAYIF